MRGAESNESDPTRRGLAVGAVYLELVSGPESLIHRENTGKLSRSRLPARPASPIRPVLEVLAGVFPGFGNREIPATEHGFADPEYYRPLIDRARQGEKAKNSRADEY